MKHTLAIAAFTAFAASGFAAASGDHSGHKSGHDQKQPATTAAPAASPMADAEVRKIDKEQGKITLKHGEIKNLDMPGMTMVFRVADPKMLDTVKEGDKIRFNADKVGGAFTVTKIESAN